MSRQQTVVRAVMLASVVGAVVTTWLVGGPLNLLLTTALFGMLAVSVIHPDSPAGLLVLIAVMWYWTAAVDDPLSPWAVLVAVLVLTCHTATALAAAVPPTGSVDAVLLRRWGVRLATVAPVAGVVWLLAVAADRIGPPSGVVVAATLALLAVVAWRLRAGLRAG